MKQEKFGMSLHIYEDYKPICPVKDAEIIFVLEGEISVNLCQNVYRLKKDDLILINIGQTYRLETAPGTLICLISVSRDLIYAEIPDQNVQFWCNSVADKSNYKPLKNIIGNLLAEYSIDLDSLNLKKKILFFQLLDQLLNHFVLDRTRKINDDLQDNVLSKVIAYIQENYKKNISLSDAANLAFMSNSAFSRYFKKNMGINYLEYVHGIRLKNAAEELLHTEKSVIEIAIDHGFTTSSRFSKVFKKSYGMSPTEYKRIKRGRMYLSDPKTENSQNEQYREKLKQMVRVNYKKNRDITAQYQFTADVTMSHPYKKIWNQCVNAGSMVSLLQIKMQELLCEINKELGITFVKISNIFGWELRIRTDRQTRDYNFEMLDYALDFLVNNGMKPVFDTAHKPDRVMINTDNIIPLDRTDAIFRSLDECLSIVEEFTAHIVKRYGLDEVSSWIFEIGKNPGTHINEEYFEMYDAVSGVIKSHIPMARIWGCCISLGINYKSTLDLWMHRHRKPDCISIIAYPYIKNSLTQNVKYATDQHYLYNEIQKIKKSMAECGAENIPLVIGEWNLSFSDRNIYNDSCGKAAQMLMNMVECMEEVEMASYQYATDLNSINYDTNSILYGGTGLMSKDGLAKPAFYAVQFLNRLGSNIVQRGDRYIVTADGEEKYDILIFNYKRFSYNYFLKKEEEIEKEDLLRIFEDDDPVNIKIELTGVRNGEYYYKSESLGTGHGSVMSVWEDLNYEKSLTQSEQKYFKKMSSPRITIRKQYINNGRLELTETLEPHEFRLIHLYR